MQAEDERGCCGCTRCRAAHLQPAGTEPTLLLALPALHTACLCATMACRDQNISSLPYTFRYLKISLASQEIDGTLCKETHFTFITKEKAQTPVSCTILDSPLAVGLLIDTAAAVVLLNNNH